MVPALKACTEVDMVSEDGTWSQAWHLGWSLCATSVASCVVTVERRRSIRAKA
jgi:hypothetical protein